ncbi:MAG: methylenetetrahydrofolate reductase [Deltaproteobacteria bacterium]|nr:methylenetetrahydrofolate reductase [Deltaproteobacteria bacterium]MBW2070559.1 methylenetetrahydrofolate reductase [Deltaproteobacteria bacterium]
MKTTTPSKLEAIIAAGHLAVTSECGPPRSCDGGIVEHKAELIKDHVDAINVTDNQTAVVRLCSLASCIRIKQMGLEPVLQMVTRDRNRIAIQSDLLGAASFGIHNVLCLTGDHQHFGDHPNSINVFDLDSTQLIQTVKLMRDEGRLIGGFELKERPQMFIGAAANPFADPFEIRVARLAKKVAAGVQFIQTQCIYNMEKFKSWLQQVRDRALHEKVAILAGLTPMKNVGMARYMKNRVPGIDVPDEIISRLAGVPKEKQAEEGIKICVEQIEELKEEEGIRGFHIMAIEWEQKVPEIVERAGLYPRPQVSAA